MEPTLNTASCQKPNIVIITDSRGAGLERILREKSLTKGYSLDINVDVYRGAKFNKLCQKASIAQKDHHLVVILGGICSLTEKKGSTVTYSRKPNELVKLRQDIDDILCRLGKKLLIGTIPPASVIKHNLLRGNTVGQIEKQQKDLEEDLGAINRYISDCENRITPLIKLDLASTRSSIKKKGRCKNKKLKIKKFDYRHMRDGVHADDHLKKLWADKIINAINSALSTSEEDIPSQESSPEEDWGDFKRKRDL